MTKPEQEAPLLHMRALGEAAVWLDAGSAQDLSIQRRIWALAVAVATWSGVIDVVPGMNNLTVFFEPRQLDVDALAVALKKQWPLSIQPVGESRLIDIPVQYGGVDGPDLNSLAEQCGLTPEEVIERHTAPEYTVYFLGFQPGFPYLAGLDPVLALPRRSEPRVTVPAGSIAIGGAQTGIYPQISPGGWHLIGRTTLKLFDAAGAQPALLQAGDRLRFVHRRELA